MSTYAPPPYDLRQTALRYKLPPAVLFGRCRIKCLYRRLLQDTKAAVMQNSGLCACLIDAAAVADISHVAGGGSCVTCDV
jgi:hypothetical protein